MGAKRRIGYAEVAATLALVMSMSGVGIAAFRLPRDSVTQRELAPNSVGSPEIINGQVTARDLAPGVRAVLISLIHAVTEGQVAVGGAAFADVLSRDLPSAGDEGLRLIDGNVEVTNPNAAGIVRMQVGLFSGGQLVGSSMASIPPGQTLTIPVDGTIENVDATTLTMRARTDGADASVDKGSMSVTTSARRNH
ncbi:MAG: hypothetical protein ACRDKT_16145 [Actinomycetota bacterium]